MIESRALRLISQTGRSAEDLAAQVRIRVIERIERLLRFESAIAKLTEAIVDRKVTTTTAPDTGPYKGRTSPGHQLGVQLRGLPPGWFFRRDVLALWPVAPADNPRDSKKPTSAAARRVWKEYVAGHLEADTMPTFQDGLASLRASFPGQKITIAVYKDLRASDITPPEWREAGRRR
jgi:hypothetical protein